MTILDKRQVKLGHLVLKRHLILNNKCFILYRVNSLELVAVKDLRTKIMKNEEKLRSRFVKIQVKEGDKFKLFESIHLIITFYSIYTF